MIFIILNEGWYNNSFGARQFLYFSNLRAIENRKSIARSSNCGISAFIDQRGKIINLCNSNKGTALKGNILLNNKLSFYTLHGNFIGKFSLYCLMFFFY